VTTGLKAPTEPSLRRLACPSLSSCKLPTQGDAEVRRGAAERVGPAESW